jgi:hypothetical protein
MRGIQPALDDTDISMLAFHPTTFITFNPAMKKARLTHFPANQTKGLQELHAACEPQFDNVCPIVY